jgi:hypothetical protein
MEQATFTFTGDPVTLRDQVVDYLRGQRYEVRPRNDWQFEAELGSAVGKAMLGVFTKNIRLEVAFNTAADGAQTLTVTRTTVGWAGGLDGVIQAGDQFDSLMVEFQQRLAHAGLLVGEPLFR